MIPLDAKRWKGITGESKPFLSDKYEWLSIGKQIVSKKHKDCNAYPATCIFWGDYTGGDFYCNGEKYGKGYHVIDLNEEHYSDPILSGTRMSIVFFTFSEDVKGTGNIL